MTNNFINTSSSHLLNKHRLSYSFELSTEIKLISLDFSITWGLDSCWLSDNPCATNVTREEIDINDFNEYYEYDDSNYDTENVNYDDEDGAKSNESRDMLKPPSSRHARNIIETNTKLVYSSKSYFKFNSHLKRYETHLNVTLNGQNLKNLQNKKYFFCYLKPCSVCECMSDKLETKVKKN